MKRNFLILLFLFVCLFSADCKTADAPNTNQTTVTNSVAGANAAVNTEKKLPAEVPVFTDANEAAAAGDRYLDAGSTENAINAFRQAVKINPDFAEAYFKLGIAYSLSEKETKDLEQTAAEPTP
ncbi:MAG: tetratricopeptide repeat protein, partial [Acidobacteriota bacterium]|nr:tetratricopeptide repeat protein [Acidobacteriota bacterium]